jgi:hypothetical protein
MTAWWIAAISLFLLILAGIAPFMLAAAACGYAVATALRRYRDREPVCNILHARPNPPPSPWVYR